MTSTSSLPAKIEAVRKVIDSAVARYCWPETSETLRAVLVTLQQHERLEAVVKAAWRTVEQRPGHSKHMTALYDALRALDTAAPETPTDTEVLLYRKDAAQNSGGRR